MQQALKLLMNYCMLQEILICVGSTKCKKPVMKCYTCSDPHTKYLDRWLVTATLTLGHMINVPRPSSFLPTLIQAKELRQPAGLMGHGSFLFQPLHFDSVHVWEDWK